MYLIKVRQGPRADKETLCVTIIPFATVYSIRHVVLKVAIDQLISAPLFFAVYFGYIGAVQGEDLEGIQRRWLRWCKESDEE